MAMLLGVALRSRLAGFGLLTLVAALAALGPVQLPERADRPASPSPGAQPVVTPTPTPVPHGSTGTDERASRP
jgi:hypothetical protein